MMKLLLALGITLLTTTPEGSPVWRYAANAELKLFGGVLIGDEHGTYADQRLPEGWVWLGGEP